MENWIRQIAADKEVSVCIRNAQGIVTFQNKICSKLCGKRTGTKCTDGCAKLTNTREKRAAVLREPIVLKRRPIYDQFCDVVFLPTGGSLMTLLYPQAESFSEKVENLENYGLTHQETEIAKLLLQGMTNREIATKLFISKATLKTHINRIYRKTGKRLRLSAA